jgi:DNA end-binding protein Ku
VPEHRHRRAEREHDERGESRRGLRPFWSGTLSFGLVSIPVDLYSGTRAGGVALRMLGPEGTPLERHYYCPDDGSEVPNDELVRGYEYEKGEYVEVGDDELSALEPEKSRDIDLRLFVPATAIDPVYFDRSYLLAPAGDSSKAYRLLAEVMQRTGRAGIATFVMREREYLVAITAEDGLLRAETLRFHDEVRSIEGVGLPRAPELDRNDVKRFTELIAKHASERLDADALTDDAAVQLEKLANAKKRSKKDVVATDAEEPEDQGARVLDLMQMLKSSLKDQAATKPKPARKHKR